MPDASALDSIALVPPRRLGKLLAEARMRSGENLAEVAARAGLGPDDLAGVERGERHCTDEELEALLEAYRVEPEGVVPSRTRLVVDLDENRLVVGEATRELGSAAPTADEVLTTYLSLVYTLRHAEPGTPIVLRDADLDVLSRALELTGPDVQRRLQRLMEEPDGEVRSRVGLLRARVLVPVAGVVVAATATGVLLLVAADDATPPTTEPAVVAPPATEPVELGPATVQTPEGVVVHGEGIPVDRLPPGAVNLGEPQTAVREPDGTVRQFPTPVPEPDPQSGP